MAHLGAPSFLPCLSFCTVGRYFVALCTLGYDKSCHRRGTLQVTEEENENILRKGYQLWNNSKAESIDYWLNLITDNIKWGSIVSPRTIRTLGEVNTGCNKYL